ncbi:MAG: Gfo/Idh/MocA family oxidoreductase [Sedimentisphaerales bacterium]|nr:Gfo/Idh/MocA family oxidoreductase [Sedimentisphaerales bacterium]
MAPGGTSRKQTHGGQKSTPGGSGTNRGLDRREFLRRTGAAAASALAAPCIVPATVFGAAAPSNRIVMGCIGLGGMGTNNLMSFMANPDVQMVAVCDPEQGTNIYDHWYNKGGYLGRQPARDRVNAHYADQRAAGRFKGCAEYLDYRDLLAREDIDAVMIATPDHWHAVQAIHAARAGKHIYGEKPLSLTIAEGRAMVEAVRRHGVVFQTGTHHRSADKHMRFICELIRNGRIGELKRVRACVDPNNRTSAAGRWDAQPVPPTLDYAMWLGPAPWAPYHRDRTHYSFRFVWDHCGGQTTNLGVHVLDIVQWAMGTDRTGPVEVEDRGGVFPQDGLFSTATKVDFLLRYANGVEVTCQTSEPGTIHRFEGTEGWIETTWSNFTCHPASLRDTHIGPEEIHLYQSSDHKRNFLDCIKTGAEPICPVEIGHRSTSVCHLGNIAMKLQRRLRWDPDKERFLGDDQANCLLAKPLRAPWSL